MNSKQRQSLAASWSSVRMDVAKSGINLCAAMDCEALRLHTNIAHVPQQGSLLLFGAGGDKFWRSLKSATEKAGALIDADAAHVHLVDEFSATIVNAAIAEHFGALKTEQLYPGNTRLMLSELGEHLGWSFPSPLGLGINPEHGLWFAYRALVWVDAPVGVDSVNSQASHPCQTCVSKDCIAACPAAAVTVEKPFALKSCASFRLQPDSDCTQRCLARLACPIGADSRQSLEQHGYHQRRSLPALAKWLSAE